jgi:hypothetical protein
MCVEGEDFVAATSACSQLTSVSAKYGARLMTELVEDVTRIMTELVEDVTRIMTLKKVG